ncbi:transferase spermidine synthase [Massilia horti]|uniref:Transferase spermidine synthase n=1 Tax=Massilia horti TaxID=2562153 RepID=A0A4Y9T8V3_9BURK|nr:transferase spermidine synthase [Massilia horti]TFW35680.1 transferase spermidine synthase [Massilia horti]
MPPLPQPADSSPPTAEPPPLVRTRAGQRTLEFTPGDVQSAMLLARPNALVLAYARAMMCFALFVPRPRHIVMVGLGGGSLAKFCYRHFPTARLTVIELRADVIALRDQFHVPPDDERFTVIQADAVDYVGSLSASADVLLVDGFNADGLPPALGSEQFYVNCRRLLREGGVLVANIFSYDPNYEAMLARLRLAFGHRICWFDGIAGNNRILFAARPGPHDTRAQRMQRLVARRNGLGMGLFNRLLARLVVLWLERRAAWPSPRRGRH